MAVSVEEYLSTSYDPDVEYVDGVLEERNVGDWLHSLTQSNILFALRTRYPHLKVVTELRSRTAGTRFRLPDVSVVTQAPNTEYLIDAAFIAIEVLSKDDRMTKVIEKLAEYAAKGVPNIWLIDPRLKLVSVYEDGALKQVNGERVMATGEHGNVELTRDEIFAD